MPNAGMGEGGKPARQACTFFLRTGTCAYSSACKFIHPADCPAPQLNTRGYPLRACEPDCVHYLKARGRVGARARMCVAGPIAMFCQRATDGGATDGGTRL